jgi:hypothetical protein
MYWGKVYCSKFFSGGFMAVFHFDSDDLMIAGASSTGILDTLSRELIPVHDAAVSETIGPIRAGP